MAPLRLLPLAIWARLATGAGLRYNLVVEDMIGAARLPFFAPLFPTRAVLGFWFQDNTGFFQAHYSARLAKLGAAVQSVVLAVHRQEATVCPSNASRDWLVNARGFRPGLVGVFYPSADPDNLADASIAFTSRPNRFVSIGNFRRVKRFEAAITTLAQLRETTPDAELALIGRPDDPVYLGELRRLARDLGVSDRVSFHISISDAQKYELLARSKALTVHSATEGFALTVTEAGLCGVPSVVNSSVPAEAFEPGITGIRVSDNSPSVYARELTRLMSDSMTWERLSRGALTLSQKFKKPSVEPSLEPIISPFLDPRD